VSDVTYLFRKPGSHIFITPRDTEYRYEFLCGRCEYPVAADEKECPRCQLQLEDCPVCTRMKHRKAPKVEPRGIALGKTCPVCQVRRIPFGETTLAELQGSFCTNLYGCPAGGLLLQKGEFALLPENASLCPVCRDESILPLAVEALAYRLRRCLFCSTCFGPASSWAKGWLGGSAHLDKLGQVLQQEQSECPLCGRHDYMPLNSGLIRSASLRQKDSVRDPAEENSESHGLTEAHFLRVCELGRSLILNYEDDAAFEAIFPLWHDNAADAGSEGFISVGSVVDHLINGTLRSELRQILQRRLERFLIAWRRKLGQGSEGYRIPITKGPA
jgi:RNA polymerase subunit RPABC4/transcription elongation factor Spt4